MAGVHMDVFANEMQQVWQRCTTGHPLMDFDGFLYSEDDGHIERIYAGISEDMFSDKAWQRFGNHGNGNLPKWVAKQESSYRRRHLFPGKTKWQPSMASVYPGYLMLSARTRHLVDASEVDIPTSTPMALHLDQSEFGFVKHGVNTVVPNSLIWLAHRARLAEPREKLALQGLWLPDSFFDGSSAMSPNLLSNLAGNSFNTGQCACSLFTGLFGYYFLLYHAEIVRALRDHSVIPAHLDLSPNDSSDEDLPTH